MRLTTGLLLSLALLGCKDDSPTPVDDSPITGGDDSQVSGDDSAGGDDSQVTDDTSDPGDCPTFSADSSALSWSGTTVGSTATLDLVVSNLCTGTVDLDLSAALSGSSAFSFTPSTASVAPGESTTFTVSFTPPDTALHEGVLTLSTNDSDTPSWPVALTGSADTDADDDGHDAVAAGGDDCDDTDPAVHTGAEDAWYDGVDSDCAGNDDYDQDGDGVASDAYGGTDCDDTNAAVTPGASETWYDGVDGDCAGGDDYDQDGDGEQSDSYGGTDCDDTDATINSAGTELQNAEDDDCDGLADEGFISAGDLIVSEIMMNPAAVADSSGEWFEIYNASGSTINLGGWVITSTDGQSFTVNGVPKVKSGKTIVLGVEKDTTLNGGATVTARYSFSKFELGDSSDSISLTFDGATISSLSYDSSWPIEGGASIQLDPAFLTAAGAADGDYWCASISAMSGGDAGSPAAANDTCQSVDHDGDGYSVDDGDCDDADPSVSPGQSEVFDGVDNDCDGLVDVVSVDEVAVSYLSGGSQDYLGYLSTISVGDLTGDGTLDFLTGGPLVDDYARGAGYLLDGSDFTSWAGDVENYDEAKYRGGYYYNYFGVMGPEMGDVTGDGNPDIVFAGSDYYYSSYGNRAISVWEGGGSFAAADADDADYEISGSSTASYSTSTEYYPMVISHVDLDGDGVDELIYGDPDDGSEGTTFIFQGGGFSTGSDFGDADVELSGDSSGDNLGQWLGGGDLDGDGYEDLFIGAPGDNSAASNSGSIFVISGSTSLPGDGTMGTQADGSFQGAAADDDLGARGGVVLGDLDGDGSTDAVVGSPFAESVYVFFDGAALSGDVGVGSADVSIENGSSPNFFGHGLAIGDFDGDGAAQLAVGAPDGAYADSGDASTEGVIYLFNGSSLAAATSSLTEADAAGGVMSTGTTDHFGHSLLAADLDGDGAEELISTAHLYDSTYGRIWFIQL